MSKSKYVKHCATMPHHFYLADTDEVYQQNRRAIEKFNTSARFARRTSIAKIPVVVHVIYDKNNANISREQIYSQIEVLNLDFRLKNTDASRVPNVFKQLAGDAMIEFELAKRDPHGNATNGITRTKTSLDKFPYDSSDRYATEKLDKFIKKDEFGKSAWPSDQYLNMWVCSIDNGLLGYAQFPGGPAWSDGVVINNIAFGTNGIAKPPYNLGRTATHEVAHFFDLLHIWGDDNGGCHRSDNVADTPNQAGANYDTPTFPSISCGNGPNGDMFMNYMDYVDDEAMFMFTKGQIRRMHATLSGSRNSLENSDGLIKPTTKLLRLPKTTEDGGRRIDIGKESGDSKLELFDGVDWVSKDDQ